MCMARVLWSLGLLAALAASATTGCSRGVPDAKTSSDAAHEEHHHHDHDERPESYAAAVDEIKQHGEEVAQAFGSGDPEAAHEALHELGDLLTILPEVAGDTEMSKADWSEVKQAAGQLFEAYGDLDLLMHKKDKDAAKSQVADKYDGMKDRISSAMNVLGAKLAVSGEEASTAQLTEEDHAAETREHEHTHEHEHEKSPIGDSTDATK